MYNIILYNIYYNKFRFFERYKYLSLGKYANFNLLHIDIAIYQSQYTKCTLSLFLPNLLNNIRL